MRKLAYALRVVAAVGLSAAASSVAHAQGSEPRLLVPAPGPTTPATPVPGSSVPQGAMPPAPQQVAPAPTPAATPATARLEVRMTQLEQDLRTVTGRLEEVSYQIRKLDDRLTKVAADMDYRLSQAKSGSESGAPAPETAARDGSAGAVAAGGGAVASTPRPPGEGPSADNEASKSRGTPPAAAPSAPSQTASLPPKTPREQYARAFSLLEKRNYEEAGAGFSDFLKSSPNDPLADNARYWLGETYYARGEYARSAEIFLDAYEKNKTGPKAPDTLLKLGLSLAALDKKKEACASFRELNRVFPNAPSAVKERATEESKRLNCS